MRIAIWEAHVSSLHHHGWVQEKYGMQYQKQAKCWPLYLSEKELLGKTAPVGNTQSYIFALLPSVNVHGLVRINEVHDICNRIEQDLLLAFFPWKPANIFSWENHPVNLNKMLLKFNNTRAWYHMFLGCTAQEHSIGYIVPKIHWKV